MKGWMVGFATGATLVLAACSTAPDAWEESGGAAHPFVGRIYRAADARQVSQADLI
jgi:starvation-inducible outer membrane lipoprotein